MTKQVIVMRTDLNMRRGKQMAQAAHSSLKVFLDRMIYSYANNDGTQEFRTHFTPAMLEWCNWSEGKPGFTKIVVGCDGGEPELREIEKKANELGIPNAIMIDNGCTEFHGVKTATCIAIGPDDAEKIDQITKNYKLL